MSHIIPRKRRKSFERFLHHDDARIRALAENMQEEDRTMRRLIRTSVELDEIWVETSQQIGTECNEESDAESGVEHWPAEIPF